MDDPVAIGPWLVLGRLGAGGMGVVYRARHFDTGVVAAVKTLRTDDPLVTRALRREVRALARMRHPGVVTILEDGQQDGVPWYAMALVDGPTLGGVRLAAPVGDRPSATTVNRAEAATRADLGADDVTLFRGGGLPAHPAADAADPVGREVDLPRLSRVYARLAAALAWVHGEGVVHQDLKPSNVVLREGDFPVLVDFGLAGAFAAVEGREALEIGGFGGTVAYLSPEQIRGDAVDARADLYALGVMLFRALTGRAPFVGSASDVIAAHLERPAPPVDALVGGVPRGLAKLVEALLAKDPRDRIGHAGVVAVRLAEWAGADAIPDGWPAPRPYLYRAAVAGRSDARRWLDEQLDHGRVALVGGSSGMGKTRLLVETGRQAAARGQLVVTGRAVGPTEAGAGPLHPLRGPLEQLAERHRADPERVFADRGSVLAPFAAGMPEGPPVVELPAAQARQRLVGAVADTLRAAARCEPLLVLLDDLHDADALTIEVLDVLAREEAAEPLVLVGTWRSDALDPAVAPLLDRPEAARMRLAPLDAASLTGLVGDMLAEPVAERLSAFLQAHAEGNPLFVSEYLRAAVDRGMLARDAAGRWAFLEAARPDELGLPRTIDGLLAQRLVMLDADLRGVAELAAVLGRDVDAGLLARAGSLAEEALSDALRGLVDRQVLAETPSGARFAHPALQARLYEGIAPERRAGLHRAVLGALPESPATLAARAHHTEQAGESEAAAELWLEAGKYAIGLYDHAAAESALRACLRVAGPQVGLMARFQLGFNVLRPQGRLEEATVEAELELAGARATGDLPAETRAMRSLGAYAVDRGHLEEARGRFTEALALDQERGNARGCVYAVANLGAVYRGLGRQAEAIPVLEQGIAAAPGCGLADLVPNFTGQLAAAHHEMGDLVTAEALYVEAIAGAAAVEDRPSQAQDLGNLANLRMTLGRLDEAADDYRAAAEMQRAAGWALAEGLTLRNYGWLQVVRGEPIAAEASFRRAITLYRALQKEGEDGLARAQVGLSDALHAQGRHEDSAAAMAEIRDPAESNMYPEIALRRARCARLLGQTDRFEALMAEARRARDALEQGGSANGAAALDTASAGDEMPWRAEEAHLALARGEPFDLADIEAWLSRLPAVYRVWFRPHLEDLEAAMSNRSRHRTERQE